MRFPTLLATALVTSLITVPTATAAPPSHPDNVVTLITGDQVAVRDKQLVVLPAKGREHIGYFKHDKHIIPRDAMRLVASGKLDKRLFDVTALAEQRILTPRLIVRHRAESTRTMRPRGGELWNTLKNAGDIEKIWLDGKKKLHDAETNAQVGVPRARELGLTGKGVTVAVLDSGYDPTHPDLRHVKESQDFTGTGIKDTHGHGTHTASILAGSGAVSNGRNEGVAPGVNLLIGKVCTADECDDSAILAGMEWAASKAQVVSMSLGGGPTDGTDPLAQAVNELSARTGTLFVISAGNDGTYESVNTPASADQALAVSSVSKQNVLSEFSSRGPRVRDYAMKPDLTAPGEDVVGARAAGTSMGTPVDEHQTSASGTSMAAPHVAGAAALVAQAHPGWRGDQLKTALMGGAAAQPDQDVFSQGTGRLDVARAVTQAVRTDTPSLSFGYLKFPQQNLPPVTKQVTYRNDGSAPVTLRLTAPGGAFSLASDQVTVPAQGTASVAVTMEPKKASGGYSGGRIIATDGGSVVQTILGVTPEPESYDVTINVIDRDGKPAADGLDHSLQMVVLQYPVSHSPDDPELVNGKATVRVLKGPYGVDGVVATGSSMTTVAVPRIMVDKPGITVTLDARQGRKLSAVVDQPGAKRAFASVDPEYMTDGPLGHVGSTGGYATGGSEDLYAVPVKSRTEEFNFGYVTTLTAGKHTYHLALPVLGEIPANTRFRVRDKDLATERAHYRAQGVLATAYRTVSMFYLPQQFFSSGSALTMPLPAERIEHYSAGGIRWFDTLWQYRAGAPRPPGFDGEVAGWSTQRVAGTTTEQNWNHGVFGPDISRHDFTGVLRDGDVLQSIVWPFAPTDANHSADAFRSSYWITARTTLSRDGKEIGAEDASFARIEVPKEAATYRLAVSASRKPTWSTMLPKVDVAWTFRSAAGDSYLPLLTARVHTKLDDHNRAQAGKTSRLEVTVATQPEAPKVPVTSFALEFSVDDGATWSPGFVRGRNGDVWFVDVPNPADRNRSMSLRIKSSDRDGNAVDQTLIKAYGLR